MLNIKAALQRIGKILYTIRGSGAPRRKCQRLFRKKFSCLAQKETTDFFCCCSCIHSIWQNCFNVEIPPNIPRVHAFQLVNLVNMQVQKDSGVLIHIADLQRLAILKKVSSCKPQGISEWGEPKGTLSFLLYLFGEGGQDEAKKKM